MFALFSLLWFFIYLFLQCQEDAQQQIQEYKEIIKQVEEDEERKIHDIQIKYEMTLYTEKESNANLKGEADVMTQKVSIKIQIYLLCAQCNQPCSCLIPLGVMAVLQCAEAGWWQVHRNKAAEAGAAETAGIDPLPGEWHWGPEEADLWTRKDQPGQGGLDQAFRVRAWLSIFVIRFLNEAIIYLEAAKLRCFRICFSIH